MSQDEIAIEGKKFLSALKSRAPNLTSAKIVEGRGVTRTAVMTAMDEVLDSLTSPGSIFFFYYGGHGIRPGGASPVSWAPTRGGTYLAMTRMRHVSSGKVDFDHAVLLDEIMLEQAKYEHVYFMGYIDACYSGNESFVANQLFYSSALGPRGFLLCSSGSTRKSYSLEFTKALSGIYNSDQIFAQICTPRII